MFHSALQNFTHQFTSYGNCWTFNSGEDNDILRENQPGSGNGLFMVIDIKQVSHVPGSCKASTKQDL